MSYRDVVLRILRDTENNTGDAADIIYAGARSIAIYVITIGLEQIKAKKRRERRQELRREVRPEFVHKPGTPTASVVLTKRAAERVRQSARDFFGEEGWMIGDINIGIMTKERLQQEANRERASAKGSMRNAHFYEALAEPLAPGQKCAEHWDQKTAARLKKTIWKDTEDREADLR